MGKSLSRQSSLSRLRQSSGLRSLSLSRSRLSSSSSSSLLASSSSLLSPPPPPPLPSSRQASLVEPLLTAPTDNDQNEAVTADSNMHLPPSACCFWPSFSFSFSRYDGFVTT